MDDREFDLLLLKKNIEDQLKKVQEGNGPKGDPGRAGKDGKDGKEGKTGAKGAQGPQGPSGPQGTQGTTGAKGKDGLRGPSGPAGAKGAQGPKGDMGPEGKAAGELTEASIDVDGHLVFTRDDGSVLDAGLIPLDDAMIVMGGGGGGSGGSSFADGTADDNTLRWDGSAWVESDTLSVSTTAVTVNGTLLSPGAGANSFRAGPSAGATTQGALTVAVGNLAGNDTQGDYGVGVGYASGQTDQKTSAVAVGRSAGNNTQGQHSVAIGTEAGKTTQGGFAVAVGREAGETTQGANSVAVGRLAGQTNQGDNGVIINASGAALNDTTNGHIHIASDDGSIDFTTAGGWGFTGGDVTANAFIGDGSQLTNLPGGGGSDLSVEDEGTELTSGATVIDFTGTGVTATNSGTEVTVDVTSELENQWRNIFGDKPFREDIWIGAATQSHGAPLLMFLDTMVESDKVYDWCTGGIDTMAFRTLTGMDATGYADNVDAPYTGHPRKEDLAGSSWPLAVELANYFDCDVYVTHTWWGGNGIVEAFYPFIDDDVGDKGDGWTEWATQSQAAQTALSGATMDIFMFMTGDTDVAIADNEMSVVIERYYDFVNMTQNELGVIDDNTRHVFYDQPDGDIWKGWRLYRSIFETWAGKDRATWVNTHDFGVVDGIHTLGNSQIEWGNIALKTLINKSGGATVGAAEFQRNHIPLGIRPDGTTINDGLSRHADHVGSVGTLGVGGFSLNAAKTELALPYEWHHHMTLFDIAGTLYPIPSVTGVVPNIQNFRQGMRIRLYDAVDYSNWELFEFEDSGTWSNSLPDAHGVPDHKLYTVSSVSTGGTGMPAYGAGTYDGKCTAQALPPIGSILNWPRSAFDAEPGGFYHNTKPVFNSGLKVPRAVEEDNPMGFVNQYPGNEVTPVSSIVFLDAKGNTLSTIEGDAGVYRRSLVATMDKSGLFTGTEGGMFGLTIDPDIKCLLDATVHLSGRRTDDFDTDKIYGASYRFMTNYHATGTGALGGVSFVSSEYGLLNPDTQAFSQDAGFNAVIGTGTNYLVRGSSFYPPANAGVDYTWTACVDYIITVYS